MPQFVLGLWIELFGVSVETARRWRAVVANIVGDAVPVSEKLGPFPQWLPCLAVIEPRPAIVPPDIVPPVNRGIDLSLDCHRYALPENTVLRGNSYRCNAARNRDYIGTPSKCRQRGSVRFGGWLVNWLELSDDCGSNAVSEVLRRRCCDWRRLDLLASVFIRGKKHTIQAVETAERLVRLNSVGFTGLSDSTITHGKAMASHDANLLARIIAQAESRIVERERLADLAEKLADGMKAGFGLCLKAGLSQEITAETLGVTSRTIRNWLKDIRQAVSGFGSELP